MQNYYRVNSQISKKHRKLSERFGEEFVENYLVSMLNFIQDTNFGQTEAMEENWARTIISDQSGNVAKDYLIKLLYDLQDEILKEVND